jgi:hypothetical protein
MYPTRLAFRYLLLTSTLVLGGCLGKTPPSEFYMLEPLPGSATRQENAPSGKPIIALAPVRIPQYVDRPQIVRATGPNVYRLDELNRWAEPLDANISRVLIQDLSVLVPADVVLVNVSNRAKLAEVRVSVDILEFHVDPEGQARMAAQWQLTRGDDTVLSRQSDFRVPASATDHRAMAEALSQCVNRLAQEIAVALRQNVAGGTGPVR